MLGNSAVAESGLPVPTELGQVIAAVEEDTLVEAQKEESGDDVAASADALVQADAPTAPHTGLLSGGLSEEGASGSNEGSSGTGQDCDSASEDITSATSALNTTVSVTPSPTAIFRQGAEGHIEASQASSEEQGDVEVSVEEVKTQLEAVIATCDGEFKVYSAAGFCESLKCCAVVHTCTLSMMSEHMCALIPPLAITVKL